jgi:hypothetical protein
MKIAIETTIKRWATMKGCEHIEFTKLKCSSEQVAEIDYIISNGLKGDIVTLTIEAAQKKLQIPAIISPIKLTGIDCRKSGKKLIVTGFKSPNERAEIMKRLTDIETPITITIEDKQGKLPIDNQQTFDEIPKGKRSRKKSDDRQQTTDKNDEDFDDNPDVTPSDDLTGDQELETGDQRPATSDYEVNEEGVITNPTEIKVELPKTYRTKVAIRFGCIEKLWYFGLDIEVPKVALDTPVNISTNAYASVTDCLKYAKETAFEFIEAYKGFKYGRQVKAKIEKAIDEWLFENT